MIGLSTFPDMNHLDWCLSLFPIPNSHTTFLVPPRLVPTTVELFVRGRFVPGAVDLRRPLE